MDLVPYYNTIGTLVLPDKTTWNPAGLGKKLAFSTDRGDGENGWFQIPIATTSAPATAADTCSTGTISFDASYIYVCVADNTWLKAAIATW